MIYQSKQPTAVWTTKLRERCLGKKAAWICSTTPLTNNLEIADAERKNQKAPVRIWALLRVYRDTLCGSHRTGHGSGLRGKGEERRGRSRQGGFYACRKGSAEDETNGSCRAPPSSSA